jgi:hypothetical protein
MAGQGNADLSENDVQRTRAWTGLWVVLGSDAFIIAAAIVGIKVIGKAGTPSIVGVLTSAFTAIGTLTTAYFGIRTMSNIAQSFNGPRKER